MLPLLTKAKVGLTEAQVSQKAALVGLTDAQIDLIEALVHQQDVHTMH